MLHKTGNLAGVDWKEIASMSTVQERIQENEHRLILDRQNLAHMENSSDDGDQLRALHDALGRTFTERKFRFLNFVSDGNKNGTAEKPQLSAPGVGRARQDRD